MEEGEGHKTRGKQVQIQRIETMASSGNHTSFRWLEVKDPNYWKNLVPKEFRLDSWQRHHQDP